MPVNDMVIRIGGESGEGIVTIGEIFVRIAAFSGLEVYTFRTYPAEILGGHVTFQARISDKPVLSQGDDIDVLVNCVGGHVDAPAEEYLEDDWDSVFEINVKAAFFLSQAVANVQIPKGGGKHIHISSVRSQLGIHRGYSAYCSSKAALNLMIKQLATEWAKHQIKVNGIAPTFTRTELVKQYLDDPDFYNPLVARIPLGRVAETIDIAGMAIYLAAPASDFITGQIIFADGGVTACQ